MQFSSGKKEGAAEGVTGALVLVDGVAAAAGAVFTAADISLSVKGNNNNNGPIVNSRDLTEDEYLLLFMPCLYYYLLLY
jgi:hypothetical protein